MRPQMHGENGASTPLYVGLVFPSNGMIRCRPENFISHAFSGKSFMKRGNSLIKIIRAIVALQSKFTADASSPDMKQRGELLRRQLPRQLGGLKAKIAKHLNRNIDDVAFDASDGQTNKTDLPWVRFHSVRLSPSAQDGWYGALLFHPHAQGFYLCIMCGSTDYDGSRFRQKPPTEIQPRVDWARKLLKGFFDEHPELISEIRLQSRGKLGDAYQASTPIAKFYPHESLPNKKTLEEDILLFCDMLALIYRTAGFDQAGDHAAAFDAADDEISQLLDGKIHSGQGFGLTPPERRAVELRAMAKASVYLDANGYSWKDTSANRPYDFIATKDRVETIVEVKGTTSLGEFFFLTANEVAAHQRDHPNNGLIVVHSIELDRTKTPPVASGGEVNAYFPWTIEEANLGVLAYQYKLPK